MKDLVKDPTARVVRFSTYENLANLAESFRRNVLARYEAPGWASRNCGEILEDVEGAWTWQTIEANRRGDAPEMQRIVVAIDPPGGSARSNAECGIIVAGIGRDRHGYIMADLSDRMSPEQWARRAVDAYHSYAADRIVAEQNFGGQMVESTIRSVEQGVPIKMVTASRGKQLRAEPIAAMYETGKVHHVGNFGDLEDQMVQWVPGTGSSPDRVDALVHAITALARHFAPSAIANPTQLRVIQGGMA